MIIYNSIQEARAACEEYERRRYELADSLGIDEILDDDCAPIHVTALYRDQEGDTHRYYYD